MPSGVPAIPRKVMPHTKQAAKAIAEFNRQRTKSEKERAEKLRLENQILRAEYLKRSDLAKVFATIADAVASRIMSADIPRATKEQILRDLAGLPLAFEEVAHAQSRLIVAKNKQSKKTDDDETA